MRIVGRTVIAALEETVTGTTTGAGVLDEAGWADEALGTGRPDGIADTELAGETLATEQTGGTSATGLAREDPTDQAGEVGELSSGDAPEDRGSISNSIGTRRTPLWRRPEPSPAKYIATRSPRAVSRAGDCRQV